MAQPLYRHNRPDRLAHKREHPAQSGVEEQRLVVGDQVLVEREATGDHGHRRADAVDAVGDLVDPVPEFAFVITSFASWPPRCPDRLPPQIYTRPSTASA